jgi:hypothetical protein
MILRRRSRLVASAQKGKTSGRVAGVSTTVLMIATVILLLALAGAAIAARLITPSTGRTAARSAVSSTGVVLRAADVARRAAQMIVNFRATATKQIMITPSSPTT